MSACVSCGVATGEVAARAAVAREACVHGSGYRVSSNSGADAGREGGRPRRHASGDAGLGGMG